MPVYSVPIVLCQDFEGFFTAIPVEIGLGEGHGAAFDESPADALRQVKSYYTWFYKNHPDSAAPDFHDPVLTRLRIEVRPEYTEGDRAYPCEETIALSVPCVQGRTHAGLHVCSLPTLSMCFHLYAASNLQQIALQRMAQKLSGSTPRELARLLASKDVQLDMVRVSIPRSTRSGPRFAPSIPTLHRIAQPLGQSSFRKRFSAAWQRGTELTDLVQRLTEEKANVVLVGEHGVGKSTLLVNAVREIERRHRSDDEEEKATHSQGGHHPHRFWSTNAARLIAGMVYLGEWQQRCEEIISDLSSIDAVLCVEDLVELILRGGGDPSASIAAFLLPYLQSGELRIVSEATPSKLEACRRLLPGFVDVFQLLNVDELKKQRARDALAQLAETRTRDTKVTLEDQAIETVCRLFQRFLPYRALPGRAAGFVTELFDEAQQDRRAQISVSDVVRHFLAETGLPERLLRDDQPLECEEVLADLSRSVIGQEEPCRVIAELIATFKAGLNDPQRPLGTFLFCGPTGVGKTELAKATSRYLFGAGSDSDRLIRLDMSEYSSSYAAERLLTTEDNSPSQLIKRVRQQPFVVVLLDEIEKAAPQVFDIMLGLLDEGRLTDRYGRTTNFCSTIIIMTSNLGTSSRQPVGFGRRPVVVRDAEIRSFFRPEFFNRLDAVVTFQPLSLQTCRDIVRKELREIADREGFTKANLRLAFTEDLLELLAMEGFDDRYGARPLQRTLETRVVTVLSRYLIDNPRVRDVEISLHVDANGSIVAL